MIGGLAFVTAVAMLICIRGIKTSVVLFWLLYAVIAGGFTYAVGF